MKWNWGRIEKLYDEKQKRKKSLIRLRKEVEVRGGLMNRNKNAFKHTVWYAWATGITRRLRSAHAWALYSACRHNLSLKPIYVRHSWLTTRPRLEASFRGRPTELDSCFLPRAGTRRN
jgi:hypothetical protein